MIKQRNAILWEGFQPHTQRHSVASSWMLALVVVWWWWCIEKKRGGEREHRMQCKIFTEDPRIRERGYLFCASMGHLRLINDDIYGNCPMLFVLPLLSDRLIVSEGERGEKNSSDFR